jgi:hypothetical protein
LSCSDSSDVVLRSRIDLGLADPLVRRLPGAHPELSATAFVAAHGDSKSPTISATIRTAATATPPDGAAGLDVSWPDLLRRKTLLTSVIDRLRTGPPAGLEELATPRARHQQHLARGLPIR